MIFLDLHRLAEIHRPIARTRRDQQAVDRLLGLGGAVFKRLISRRKSSTSDSASRSRAIRRFCAFACLSQTLFKCCYKVFIQHTDVVQLMYSVGWSLLKKVNVRKSGISIYDKRSKRLTNKNDTLFPVKHQDFFSRVRRYSSARSRISPRMPCVSSNFLEFVPRKSNIFACRA